MLAALSLFAVAPAWSADPVTPTPPAPVAEAPTPAVEENCVTKLRNADYPARAFFQILSANPKTFELTRKERRALDVYLSWVPKPGQHKPEVESLRALAGDYLMPGVFNLIRFWWRSRSVGKFFQNLSDERIERWMTQIESGVSIRASESDRKWVTRQIHLARSEAMQEYKGNMLAAPESKRLRRVVLTSLFLGFAGLDPLSAAANQIRPTIPEQTYLAEAKTQFKKPLSESNVTVIFDPYLSGGAMAPWDWSSVIGRSLPREAKSVKQFYASSLDMLSNSLKEAGQSDVVVLAFHGNPRGLGIGGEYLSGQMGQIESRLPKGVLKPGVTIVFFACDFGDRPLDFVPSKEEETWIKLAKHLAKGSFTAVSTTNSIEVDINPYSKPMARGFGNIRDWMYGGHYFDLWDAAEQRASGDFSPTSRCAC